MFQDVSAVLFDAAGTLITPNPSVAQVYFEFGRRFGSQLSIDEISDRFSCAFAKSENSADSIQPTDQRKEVQRWQTVVREVFRDVDDADGPLFRSLWDHFSESRHWALYDDVADAWESLEQRNLTLGIASNFDDRLLGICRELPILSGCPHVLCSSQIGFAKPDIRFFREIERRLALQPEQILLVGDHLINDDEGARAANWQAVLLTRTGESSTDSSIGTLSELPRIID